MEKIKIKLFSIMLFILVSAYCLLPQAVIANDYVHTVVKGDTLWSICENYYGDGKLWPKLWEMNSFITNPHLLTPGDSITLLEAEKEEKQPEIVEAPPEKDPKPVVKETPKIMGIGLDGIMNLEALGFYSNEKITPLGEVFAADNKQLAFGKDDTVYIIFEKGKKVNPGDTFAIGRTSSVRHPLKKNEKGYIFTVSGKLVVVRAWSKAEKGGEFFKKDNVYQAKIISSFDPVYVGDILLNSQSQSKCILPRANGRKILANIIAARNDEILIHKDSIVYIDSGEKDGIRRGNVFDILEPNIVKDPKPDSSFELYKSNIILPDKELGKVLIIDTNTNTSTGLVLSTEEPVSKGAYLQSRTWTKTPDFIRARANCPIN